MGSNLFTLASHLLNRANTKTRPYCLWSLANTTIANHKSKPMMHHEPPTSKYIDLFNVQIVQFIDFLYNLFFFYSRYEQGHTNDGYVWMCIWIKTHRMFTKWPRLGRNGIKKIRYFVRFKRMIMYEFIVYKAREEKKKKTSNSKQNDDFVWCELIIKQMKRQKKKITNSNNHHHHYQIEKEIKTIARTHTHWKQLLIDSIGIDNLLPNGTRCTRAGRRTQ